MKIAVNMLLRECIFYSFILNFIKISLKPGTYFTEFKCKVCAGPALAIGRAGDCLGPRALRRGLHNRSLSLRRHTHGPLAKRLMHMAHLSGNTSGVSKSSLDWLNYTGFPGDVCVTFFNVPPGNKDAVMPNPLTKEDSRRVYKCNDERLSGSTKRWIFKSM